MELRRHLQPLKIFATLISLGNTPSYATTVLLGSTDFDASTSLYTYSYTVDNRSGSSVTDDFGVLFEPNVSDYLFSDFTGSTAPSGWHLNVSVGGPGSVVGTFFEWFDDGPCMNASSCSGVQVGSTLSGFSVTLPFAPTKSLLDNYYVFLPFITDAQFEVENVTAPDLRQPTVTPIPPSFVLFLSGLMLFGTMAVWRFRSALAFASRVVTSQSRHR